MTGRAILAQVFARPLYVLLMAASLWVLVRGHNDPGGGFIGGLMAVAATASYALIFGAEKASRRLPLAPLRLAAAGVLLAAISGLPAVFFGEAFLTHQWGSIPLGITQLALSTVLLFDLGVYLCVWGALSGYCLGLIREIEESP